MATASVRDELTCSICTNIFSQAVTLTCGHSYCRVCITRTWDNQEEREYSCPECRQRFKMKPKLKNNVRLCNMAENFKSTHKELEDTGIYCTYCIRTAVPATVACLHCEAYLCKDHLEKHCKAAEHVFTEPTIPLWNRKCSVHKKVLEYYCTKDAVCICVSCRLDGAHEGHPAETLNEALEKKKTNLRNILEKLTSEREETEKSIQSLQVLRSQVQEKAAEITQGVAALIKDIKKQLEALENRVMCEISSQEKKVSLQVSDLIRQLDIKVKELSRKMGDIEELCNVTDPITVLQERESHRADYCVAVVGDNEDGDDTKAHDVGYLDVALISVILHSGLAGIVTGVKRQRRVPECSDTFLNVNTGLDLLLDVNTASNDVSVSEDLKTVSLAEPDQSHPGPQERFQNYPQVLSSRSFSSGIHYWEVEGSESGVWEVGVAYPSIDRGGDQSWIGNNNKSWGLRRWRDKNLYYVIHGGKVKELPLTPSCRRLGIYLDYEVGRLSFYELRDPIRHLYTFSAMFAEPLHAVFGVDWDAFVSINGIFTCEKS